MKSTQVIEIRISAGTVVKVLIVAAAVRITANTLFVLARENDVGGRIRRKIDKLQEEMEKERTS